MCLVSEDSEGKGSYVRGDTFSCCQVFFNRSSGSLLLASTYSTQRMSSSGPSMSSLYLVPLEEEVRAEPLRSLQPIIEWVLAYGGGVYAPEDLPSRYLNKFCPLHRPPLYAEEDTWRVRWRHFDH